MALISAIELAVATGFAFYLSELFDQGYTGDRWQIVLLLFALFYLGGVILALGALWLNRQSWWTGVLIAVVTLIANVLFIGVIFQDTLYFTICLGAAALNTVLALWIERRIRRMTALEPSA